MIGVVVQARTKSKRFPNKIFTDIHGKYTLQRVLDGVTSSKVAQRHILAMPEYDRPEITERIQKGELSKYVKHRGFSVYCGEPDDVLARYYDTCGINGIDLVVRVTADCPMIQGSIIDQMLLCYLKNGLNTYMYNRAPIQKSDVDKTEPSIFQYPDGLDVEIFPWWMLAETYMRAVDQQDREHVTLYMRRNYEPYVFENKAPNPYITIKHPNFSFDTEQDFQLIKKIALQYDKYGDINKALNMVE